MISVPVPVTIQTGTGTGRGRIFHEHFAADVSAKTAALIAATQRPAATAALEEKATKAAWKTIPSWALLATGDKAIPVAAQKFMAERAKSKTVEVKASHAVTVPSPAPSPTSSSKRPTRLRDIPAADGGPPEGKVRRPSGPRCQAISALGNRVARIFKLSWLGHQPRLPPPCVG